MMPVPIIPDHTEYIVAGALTFGVEYRILNDEILIDAYKDDAAMMQQLEANRSAAPVEDQGVSIHILGTADGHEYLRFDCFQEEPHYHYINVGEGWQDRVDLDTIADGEIFDWTLERLRTRLRPMLLHAGARALADQVDYAQIEATLPQVIASVQQSAKVGRPAPVSVR
jgi:hypothetical protein